VASKHVLVLDLGTSGLRSLLAPVDSPWELTPGASLRYRLSRSRSPDDLAARFSPQDLQARIIRVLREGIANAGVTASDVSAIAITSQRQGVAFLDANGNAVYVGPNMDLRAVFEGAAMDDEHAALVYQTTGHLPSFFFTPAKLRWWHNHHPRIAGRIKRALTLGAWAAYQLTGEQADTPSLLGEAGLLDVASRQPATSLLNALGLDPSVIPPLVNEGQITGKLTSQRATELGLPSGTPVYLAGPDTQCALLGMGVTEPRNLGIVAGWSAPVQAVTESPVFDSQRRTWTGVHVLPERWVAEANAGDAGGALDMVRRILGPRGRLERFSDIATRVPVGSNMTTTFWGPQALDLSSPGVSMGGLLTPIPITYNTLRASHLARATLENIAYALRECVERLKEVTGQPARSIHLSGGISQSPIFPQILADVLNAKVMLHHPNASAVGAAIAASGDVASLGKAASVHATTVAPDVRSVVDYADLYPRWLRLRERLQELTEEL
jgi:autoinducer 2 (AI-2) kinase